MLTDRQIADDLGELVDVAGLDLVPIVLEPPIPVLGHVRTLILQHGENLLDRLLVDHATKPCQGGVLGRHHHGHVVVKDLDREVLAAFAQDVL